MGTPHPSSSTRRVLVCIGGPPGAGKSTLGRHLAREQTMTIADLDSVSTPLVEAMAEHLNVEKRLNSDLLAGFRDARYACLAAMARDNVAVGHSVVAVAPFTREATDFAAWEAWSRRVGSPPVFVWLTVGLDVASRRLAGRGLERDRARSGHRETVAPTIGALVLNGEDALELNSQAIADHIRYLTTEGA